MDTTSQGVGISCTGIDWNRNNSLDMEMISASDKEFLEKKFTKDEYGFYRGEKKEWEFKEYGFYPMGLGDLWYNDLRLVILNEERISSPCLDIIGLNLSQGKRWVSDYNNEFMAKNRIQFLISRQLYRWNLTDHRLYRSQKSMTRDPWIMFYCACIKFGYADLINYLKPQWWLYNPKVWQWRRALLGKRNIYPLLDRLTPKNRRDFVKTLDDYMKYFYNKSKQQP